MKKKVRIIIWSALGVIVAGAIAASALQPLAVEVTVMESTTARVTFTEQGVYQFDTIMEVRPLLSGELLELPVRQGDRVSKGDVLAVISARDVEYELERLQSNIRGYNAQISNLGLQERQEKDALAGTRNNLLGQITSLEAQIGSHESTEESRRNQIRVQEEVVRIDNANVRIARDTLRSFRDEFGASDDYGWNTYEYDVTYNELRQALNLAEKALAASHAQLEQLRNSEVAAGYYEGQRASLEAQIRSIDERLGTSYTGAMREYYSSMIEAAQTSIRQLNEQVGEASLSSPISGSVIELPVKTGTLVSPATPVAIVGYDAFIEVFVPVREIDGVNKGDKPRIIIDRRLGNIELDGTVTLVEEQAQVRLSALGVEERKVRVLVGIPAGSGMLIGANADVEFTVLEQPDCVVVPKTAIFDVSGQDMVWVVEGGAARRRAVEKGVETRDGFAVISGLAHGDMVITDANTSGLAEDKSVRAS